ncbi:hybrid sensor histidine kinase/response regulator [Marinovum sp.]|uniref:hybrid sensor histidine kinase/response regulator n=1 Tax=Marinovum sp. TaxID=2024839 RepID=UPI002B268500|nr:ATP-binding protein [Marinovum sp.]
MALAASKPQDRPPRFRQLPLVVLVIVLGGLLAAGMIAVKLGDKIGELRAAPSDNIQWNTAQLEVDFLKLDTALDAARAGPGGLDDLRRQFDIFYSRVKTFAGSTQTLVLEEDPALRAYRDDLDRFLMRAVPLIDAPDPELRAALPQLETWADAVNGTPRSFALGAVQVMANVSDAQRIEIIDLLRRLAFVILSVFGALILTLATMTFQRLELSRRAAAIAHAGRMRDSTLRASLDAIVVSDAAGVITDFNGSAEKIFGYPREQILGRRLTDTILPAGPGAARSAETARLVDQGRRERTARHSAGHDFPIELSISETPGESGPNFVAYIRDITEEKRAKAELQEARDEALAAFREKSHFFAVMSHEMRTPLNGIMSALDLMRDDPMTAKQKRYVDIAESSSQVLLGHINDVLLIERLDSGENSATVTAVRPVALVEAVADSLRPVAGQQNTVLTTGHSGPDACVLGPSRALQQVAMNLLNNAVKFTPGGKVTVTTRMHDTGDDEIAFELVVADTGIGISEHDQARIFDDFVTIDSPYERTAAGTGLGLGIVRRLVDQMGGRVTCDSTPGQGSTFRVTATLPRAADDVRRPETPGAAARPAGLAPLDILVVEDNPINAEVLGAMLLREGQKVSHAKDGFEGVNMARRARYDLILMDVSMPNMNGLKATRQIRASDGPSRTAPIYAVTAHAMPKEVEAFLAAGMAGCILKPIRPEVLRKVLTEVAGARPPEARDPRPVAAAPEPPDVVDAATLGEITELLGEARFHDKLAAFVSDATASLSAIDAAAAAGDLPALQAQAHRLAGSCGVFGAVALHGELQTLEALSKAGDRTAALAQAAALDRTWQATRQALTPARV